MFLNYLKITTITFLVWLIFTKFNFSPLFLIIGFISSFFTIFITYKMKLISKNMHFIRFEFLQYTYMLAKDIMLSSIQMIKIIYSDSLKVDPGIISFNASKLNRQEKVLFANLITMTPGTFVISIEGDEFLIHAIDRKNLNFDKSEQITALLHKMRVG